MATKGNKKKSTLIEKGQLSMFDLDFIKQDENFKKAVQHVQKKFEYNPSLSGIGDASDKKQDNVVWASVVLSDEDMQLSIQPVIELLLSNQKNPCIYFGEKSIRLKGTPTQRMEAMKLFVEQISQKIMKKGALI